MDYAYVSKNHIKKGVGGEYMILYIAGKTYYQIFKSTAEKKTDMMVYQEIIESNFELNKYVKQNISKWDQIDIFMIDLSALIDTDDEIIEAMQMIRSMYDRIRIILLASYRQTGDRFLSECFNLGILNIVNTQDMVDVSKELEICVTEGKKFKDALKYKDSIPDEQLQIKHIIKKAVDKVLISIAGTEGNIGVTHHAIVMANFLRKQGFMVAIVELNDSTCFKEIAEDFSEKMYHEGYFTLNGIDYYPSWKQTPVLDKPYNFIILDMGIYEECDRGQFDRCEEKFIITGSKSWETEACQKIFSLANRDALMKYHFCFNFTPKKDQEAIKEAMKDIHKDVNFLTYTEDPYMSSQFSMGEIIFDPYLPKEEEKEKKKFFHFEKKRDRHEKRKKNII